LAAQIARGACGALLEASERARVLEALVQRLSEPAREGAWQVSFRATSHPRATLRPALASIAEHRSQVEWLCGARPLASIWKAHAGTGAGWAEVEARLIPAAHADPSRRVESGLVRR